jgi:hypothetical protein
MHKWEGRAQQEQSRPGAKRVGMPGQRGQQRWDRGRRSCISTCLQNHDFAAVSLAVSYPVPMVCCRPQNFRARAAVARIHARLRSFGATRAPTRLQAAQAVIQQGKLPGGLPCSFLRPASSVETQYQEGLHGWRHGRTLDSIDPRFTCSTEF